MEIDVEAGARLEVVECCGERSHVLVGSGVGDSECGHDEDGVLVDAFEHLVGVHERAAGRHRHLTDFHIPVAGELVPDDLDGTTDEVRTVGGFTLGGSSCPPAPLGGHAGQHAGLRGADGRGSHGVGGVRCVPQVSQHVHAAALKLGRVGILVLVDQVLVLTFMHQRDDVVLFPGLAEGGEVLPGIAVQQELIFDHLHGIFWREHRGREAKARELLASVLADVDGAVEVVADVRSCVQAHGAPLHRRHPAAWERA